MIHHRPPTTNQITIRSLIFPAISMAMLSAILLLTSPQKPVRAQHLIEYRNGIITIAGLPVAERNVTPLGSGFQLTPFDYYLQQDDGSRFAQENCGPAAVAMALRYGSAMKVSPSLKEVRETYMGIKPQDREGNLGTGPADFERALEFAGAQYQQVQGAEGVWDAIHRFHPVIVPVRMRDVSISDYISYSFNGYCQPRRTAYQYEDKSFCYKNTEDVLVGSHKTFPYNPDSIHLLEDGHVILANGIFTDTRGQRYFYLYDPNVFGEGRQIYFYFGDPYLPKGQYRLWKYEELDQALQHNTNRAIEVMHNPANPITGIDANQRIAFQDRSESCTYLTERNPSGDTRFFGSFFTNIKENTCQIPQLKKISRRLEINKR